MSPQTSDQMSPPDWSCEAGGIPHPSAAHKAGCPICNPTKTVPELNAAAGALLTSNQRCPHGISMTAHPRCHFCEHERLRAALQTIADTSLEVHERVRAFALKALSGDSPPAVETKKNELTEALCFEGEKDYQLNQLLEYLHYDPATCSHPDWVARAQTAEAELARLRGSSVETSKNESK